MGRLRGMSRKRVLFVCLGNICRSPAGEGVFKQYVAERGLEGEYQADSAGTSAYHVGEPPDRRMRRAASRRGLDLRGRSRQFSENDFERFDLIVAMDRSNLRGIQSMDRQGRHQHKIKLFSDFVGDGFPVDVPDPYYGGRDGFDKVLDFLEAGMDDLLEHLDGVGT